AFSSETSEAPTSEISGTSTSEAPLPATSEAPLPATSEAPLPATSEAPTPATSEAPTPETSEIPKALETSEASSTADPPELATEFMWGNIVLYNKLEEMKAANVNLVVYPHWIHRIWFKCKVCHYTLEVDMKGTNDISMERIEKGEACGKCHNGEISFNATDKTMCNRCHSLKEDQTIEGPIFTTRNILAAEHTQRLKEVAAKVGAEWNPEKLKGDDFPRDKFGFINWVKMMYTGVVKPIHSLDPNEKDETRDTKILFQVLSDYVDNILWPHDLHTFWIKCEQCHEGKGEKARLFNPVLGANRIRMRDMVKEKKFCIHCHGKVSFPIADCLRCHKYSKDAEIEEEFLLREELVDAE
ncbi:MAG: c(7)-type cytochrome triheme domain-containing protein, partial [Thermodesulfobacteriota bacterium]